MKNGEDIDKADCFYASRARLCKFLSINEEIPQNGEETQGKN